MDLNALQQLLGAAAGARVACVGDLMLDRYVYGDVTRVSAEAPIPVLAHRSETAMLGAVGNVARNVAALGGKAAVAGLLGADGAADETVRLIGADPDIEGHVVLDATRPTTVKTRFIANGQQLLRLDAEQVEACAGQAQNRLVAAVEDAAEGAKAILLSDYGKGAVTPGVIEACRSAARSQGAVLIVDSKARHFDQYGAVDIIKPNAAELAYATDLPTDSDAEVEAALSAALERCEAGAILVTRSAKGMSFARRGQAVRHVRARAPEVFDVSGAGDTTLAALGLALAAGADDALALEFAVLASGVVVGKAGTATVSPGELIEAELAAHQAPAESKVLTLEEAAEQAERWRAKGLKVGFTNGCFDILHRGHVAYLAQAKAWCDRLIVGLNTDASVKALKGDGRPVNVLESRALVLAGLNSVDLVVPFGEATPIRLIEAIRPDLLVKGADYTVEGVVGADVVRAYGGEVRLADIVDGYSTTAAIAKMQAIS